jgi:hypothetical protein
MIRARPISLVALAAWALVLAAALPTRVAAQNTSAPAPRAAGRPGADDAFLDQDARVLHGQARARWHEIDFSLTRYQAVVSQRLAAALRMPLRDRTLYALEQSARIIWEREGGVAVQMLASKEHLPSGFGRSGGRPPRLEPGFDPAGDPLLLGLSEWSDDDEFHLEHPLDAGAERHYRFRTADTLTMSFPDSRTVRAVQLEMIPRRDDPHLLSGALWIEPESGNVVRAVYRLARPLDIETDVGLDEDDLEDMEKVPGLFRPFVGEITMIAVDYALWDLRIWMPRSLRAEGVARAGIVSLPMAIEVAYEMEEVVTEDQNEPALGLDAAVARLSEVAAADGQTDWRPDQRTRRRQGRRVRYLMPEDPAWLETSPHLPAPIWEGDAQFVRPAEFEELKAVLADLPAPVQVATMATFDWGSQRPDLLRYNRVEGLSVGARGAVRFDGGGAPLAASLTARLGSADLHPRATLALTRETLARTLTLSAYHELQQVDPSARAFGIGNSLNALVFGRDDGDYYQSTGLGLAWTPPSSQRATYRARVYAERQDSVERRTHGSLFHWVGWDDGFRDAAPAVPADQLGVELTVSPWWGQDPQRPGGGVELHLQGERGDFEFGRARLHARAALPLWRGAKLALAAGGGTTFGDAPAQRRWILGGPFSLRGFEPGALAGPSFLSGRAEMMAPLRRVRGGSALRLAFFTDAGWAGERDAVDWDGAKASAGVGLSVLDGILRLDVARGWKGGSDWRVDLYLDGLL